MTNEINPSNNAQNIQQNQGGRVIDESQYQFSVPQPAGPSAIGKGGDCLYKKIFASREQINELMEETTTVQDWIQRETCNKVAIKFLEENNLKDVYYKIKDGFGEYGSLVLMGYQTPQGVPIMRLKVLNTNGEVENVLTGPMVLDELNKRFAAYENADYGYEVLNFAENEEQVIPDYTGIVDKPDSIEEYRKLT